MVVMIIEPTLFEAAWVGFARDESIVNDDRIV